MNLYKKRILKSEEVKVVPAGTKIKTDLPEESPESRLEAPKTHGEKESAVENAYSRGLAEGRVLGRKEAEKELGNTLKTLKEMVSQLGHLRTEILKGAERDIVTLAMAIAEKVVHDELTTNRDAVKAVFHAALEAIEEKERLKVRCNPEDMNILSSYLSDLRASQGSLSEVEFIGDTSLRRGGVKIEAAFCEVDASLESQFRQIKSVLFS